MEYTSSKINKYGDADNVSKDMATLMDIIGRQGTSLLTVALAEFTGNLCNKFSLSEATRTYMVQDTVRELREALLERT